MANKKHTPLENGIVEDKKILRGLANASKKNTVSEVLKSVLPNTEPTITESKGGFFMGMDRDDSIASSVTNMITLDPISPVNFGYDNTIKTSLNGKFYVPFLNPDDNEGLQLILNRGLSTTTNAIINSKVAYCMGRDGAFIYNVDNFSIDVEKNNEFKKATKFVNNRRESLRTVTKQVFDNLFTLGNCYIEIVRGKVTYNGVEEKFVKVYVHQTRECRLSYPNDEDICEQVLISKFFLGEGGYRRRDFDTIVLPIYDGRSKYTKANSWWRSKNGDEHTILHLKIPTMGIYYYGMPAAYPAKTLMQLEYQHQRYDLDMFENNMVLNNILYIKGTFPREEAKKLFKELVHQYTGVGKKGRTLGVCSEDGAVEDIKVVPVTRSDDGKKMEKEEKNKDALFLSMQWNKELLGANSPNGTTKSTSEIRTIYQTALNTVIIPMQNIVIDGFIQPFVEIMDEWMGTKFSSEDFRFSTEMPSAFIGDVDINSMLTVDESRAMFLNMSPIKSNNPEDGNTILRVLKNANSTVAGTRNEEGNRDGNEPQQNK